VIKTFCDRCGAETNAGKFYLFVSDAAIWLLDHPIRGMLFTDLCPTCAKSLMAAIKQWKESK
jgi:hypothetical protein